MGMLVKAQTSYDHFPLNIETRLHLDMSIQFGLCNLQLNYKISLTLTHFTEKYKKVEAITGMP